MPIQPSHKHRMWKSHSFASLEVPATVYMRNLCYEGKSGCNHSLTSLTYQNRILIMFLFHPWNIHWISINFCIDGIHEDCLINFILICISSRTPTSTWLSNLCYHTNKKWYTKTSIGITYFVDFVNCVVLKITYLWDRICPSFQAKNKANINMVRTQKKGLTVVIFAEITMLQSSQQRKQMRTGFWYMILFQNTDPSFQRRTTWLGMVS